MVNFRIKENQYKDDYEEFIKLYNKGVAMLDIMMELKITNYMYRKYRRKALGEEKIKDRKSGNAKYYYKTRNGTFAVSKRTPGTREIIYYGTFKTEQEAQQVVNELKKSNNWMVKK